MNMVLDDDPPAGEKTTELVCPLWGQTKEPKKCFHSLRRESLSQENQDSGKELLGALPG